MPLCNESAWLYSQLYIHIHSNQDSTMIVSLLCTLKHPFSVAIEDLECCDFPSKVNLQQLIEPFKAIERDNVCMHNHCNSNIR